MFGSVFGAIGGFIGNAFGGGILSSAWRFIGRWIGNQLEDNDEEIIERYRIGHTIDNFYPESLALGQVIPLVFGQAKVNGRLIWCQPIKEVPIETCEAKYFSNHQLNNHQVKFTYYATFAVGICEGEIENINRIWAAGELLDLSEYKYRLYKGDENQLPDSIIYQEEGDGTPAFRGLSYIVFENFPLFNFDNKIPNFAVEVYRKPNIPENYMVEDLVKSMVMIPGSREFVYDTVIQTKKFMQKVR